MEDVLFRTASVVFMPESTDASSEYKDTQDDTGGKKKTVLDYESEGLCRKNQFNPNNRSTKFKYPKTIVNPHVTAIHIPSPRNGPKGIC